MSTAQRRALLALAAGALFGIGLGVSGMTRPEKVLGFLDVTGDWDPTLSCVMGGAVGVYFLADRWSRAAAERKPLLADRFSAPPGTPIDARLCVGALLFGAGWGLGGYCPGPAIVSAASGSLPVMIFLACMLIGMSLVRPARASEGSRASERSGASEGSRA